MTATRTPVDGEVGSTMTFFPSANSETRITIDPVQMGGVPCIRGLRIPVATVVDMVANGIATEEILRA